MFLRVFSDSLPADLAESEFNVRKLLLKRLVHVFLQIGRFDVLDYCRLREKEERKQLRR